MDRSAVELGFRVQRDDFRGSLRVLRDRMDEGFELLRLALNAPRFDAEAIERIREQMLTVVAARNHEPERYRATACGGARRSPIILTDVRSTARSNRFR